MDRIKSLRAYLPGLRTVKTGMCVALCIIIYELIGRDGLSLAVVASIICIQDSVEKSISLGINRIRGTVMGGLFAAVYLFFGIGRVNFLLHLIACTLAIIIFIHMCNILKITQSISIGCIVFLIIVLGEDTAMAPLSYSFNRTVDTLIGITVAVLVNRFIYQPTPERLASKGVFSEKTPVDFQIVRAREFMVNKWSGGTSREIYMYPEEAIYAERDFIFRIATSTVEMDSSKFTMLPGYKRYVMLLEGDMHLYHEGHHNIALTPYYTDVFMGGWETQSEGRCRDFGLTLAEGYAGGIEPVRENSSFELNTEDYTGLYGLKDGIRIVLRDGERTKETILHQGDYFMIGHPFEYSRDFTLAVQPGESEEGGLSGDVVAVAVKVRREHE